jgi:hypothetical protein
MLYCRVAGAWPEAAANLAASHSRAEGLMDGLAVADLKGVVAPLNFLAPMAEKPFSYNYEPPPGTPLRNGRPVTHQVRVRDARAVAGQLSLDREGFVLLRHPSGVSDFYDDEEVKRLYYPECERLMREATGAIKVVAFDHITRNAALSGKGNQIKQPATRVHNDYTDWSAPQRVRDLMGEEAVIIRCFDSARSGAARFSAHGAFDDPQAPADAPPRESIEVRTLVFFRD